MNSNFEFQGPQPEGGMSAGGNQTQVRRVRLYLDPEASSQGSGFWTGKYAPSGKTSAGADVDSMSQARVSLFQERGSSEQAGAYFAETPEDEEETIKSLKSTELFSLAKQAFLAGNKGDYAFFKGALQARAQRKTYLESTIGKALRALGDETKPVNKDKRVLNAMHGIDDETSTEEKDDVSVPTEDDEDDVTKARKDLDRELDSALSVFRRPPAPPSSTPAVPLVITPGKTFQPEYKRRDPRTGKTETVHGHGQRAVRDVPPKDTAPKEVKPPNWKTLENPGIVLPKPYQVRGVSVAGVKHPLAEEMCYRLAPLFLRENKDLRPDDVVLRNFTDDLAKYTQIKVEPTQAAVLKAAGKVIALYKSDQSARAKAKETLKQIARQEKEEALADLTPKQRKKWREKQRLKKERAAELANPGNFAVVDGVKQELARKLSPSLFQSSVYNGMNSDGSLGSPMRGHFVPMVTPSRVVLNGSWSDEQKKSLEAKGFKTVTIPNVEWVTKVLYPPECGRNDMTSGIKKAGKTDEKWAKARDYGANYSVIMESIAKALAPGGDPLNRRIAITIAVMDALHIRNGKGGKKDPTKRDAIGGTDLTSEHIWLKGDKLYFDFKAKMGEPCSWKAMGPRQLTPDQVRALKELGTISDKPVKGGGLVFGVKPGQVNEWLQTVTGEKHLHAHNIRHYHGTAYFAEKWAELQRKNGKPETRKEAQEMFNAATLYASLKLGHIVKGKTSGPTARKSYIDPAAMQKAMEWTGYDLSNKQEKKHDYFKFTKELLAKSFAKPGSVVILESAANPRWHDYVNLVWGEERAETVQKAIGTKSAESREKPIKRAPPPVKAKVSSTASGRKNYDYRKKGAAKNPQSTSKPKSPSGGSQAPIEVQPKRLADRIGVSVEKLQKIAAGKTEEEFVTYMKAKGSTFMAKHKVPESYLQELYAVLARDAVKSFKVLPGKLPRGSEERKFAETMVVSRVNTLPKLATLLEKGYDLSRSQALKTARELHKSLRSEGAIA